MSMTEYDIYVRAEWELFVGEPARASALLDAVRDVEVERVLDIGCGAGQELLPFVTERKAMGVGIDIASSAGQSGRDLFGANGVPVNFARAAAEYLPFDSRAFDVVICRIALPYTDNQLTLDEIARVLRSGGVLLLKIHHARFYLNELWQALFSLKGLVAVHDLRVLTAGMIYHFTGKQPRNRLTGRETFQTKWMLQRELKRRGLYIVREMVDSVPAAPSYVISTLEAGVLAG